MDRPLLLYVTDGESLGGAEHYLSTLLRHADRSRYRVGLVLPRRASTTPLVERAREEGVDVAFLEHVHRDGLSPEGIVRSLRLLRRARPALIHFVLAAPRRCAEAIVAARLLGVPRRLATFQLVTPVPRFGPISRRIRNLNRRLQFRAIQVGIAVSAGNRRVLVEQYGFPSERLRLVPNGVDTERFAPRPPDQSVRTRWGVPPDTPLLGAVGRLSTQKGHDQLLRALPGVWAAFPTAHLALIGSGELEPRLRRLAGELDPLNHIHFVGECDQMAEVLAALDIVVLPSLYEGLSFALLEAMAAARPIVATGVDGTVDAIEDGRSGLLASPGRPDALTERIVRLLGDQPLRARLGRAARCRAVGQFEQRLMLERTFALYG